MIERTMAQLQSLFSKRWAMTTVTAVLVVALLGTGVYSIVTGGGTVIKPGPIDVGEGIAVDNFSSAEEFVAYLAEADSLYASAANWGSFGEPVMIPRTSFFESAGLDEGGVFSSEAIPQRVSGTNVQVMGIDEPDIVKTDSITIFFSQDEYYYYYYEPFEIDIDVKEGVMPPEQSAGTKIISAYPPANMSVVSEIDENGEMLLYGDVLVIFTYDAIYGYDVSDPQNPVSEWQIDIGEDTYTVAARLYQGKIYLVTQTYIDTYNPSPIWPVEVRGVPVQIDYFNIYHPVEPVPSDVTFNAMVFDAETGNMENVVSFLGSAYTSVVYMSGNAIYVTYSYSNDIAPYIFEFCTQACQGILPDSVIEDINNLWGYDISDRAKLTEIEVIIDEYLYSLGSDDRLRVESDLNNALQQYYDEHKRDLERTGIVKIGLDGFALSASGSVPGTLLNQFSMDEYEGYLRVATTVGDGFNTYYWMFWVSGESANDVYVLDGDLNVVGAVQDLGLTERVYSARFVGDKGYLVTFRQIDPFYVLDLSDPLSPQLEGELKIPGYSSYLHPITNDKILGIGEEDWKVKISLFDVQDPSNPIELDKYILDDYWSEVLETHHAFLLDEKHEIFFLPGGNGGYVFSYENDRLELVKAISGVDAERALYIDDYLYVVGDDKVVVYDEVSWEQVSELDL
ncbi:MAG: beta-propeller domain-containing protein [Chloroflexota bacterium]|nr:beta-propeller domain-containing protein [Chloroflexota bacterium]